MMCCCAKEEGGGVQSVQIVKQSAALTEGPTQPPYLPEEKEENYEEKQVETKEIEIAYAEEEKAPEPNLPFSYEVSIQKDGSIGATFEALHGGVMVTQMREGSLKCYNEKCAKDGSGTQVALHDVIVEVNGTTHVEAMVKNMQTDSILKMKLMRPLAVVANVAKKDASDGLGLRLDRGERVLEVLGVLDVGAVQTYNGGAPAAMQVKAQDVIVAINDVSGSAGKMAEEGRKTSLALKLIRFR